MDGKKEKLEKQIVTLLYKMFEEGTLELTSLAAIARELRPEFDAIQNQDELDTFISKIEGKFPMFKNLAEQSENQEPEQTMDVAQIEKKEEILNKLSNYFKVI